MRTIERSSVFRRDYKREAKGQIRSTLDEDLVPVLTSLVNDKPLDARCRDHALSGDWAGYRECHIKPDLLSIESLKIKRCNWCGSARTASYSDSRTAGA